MFTPLCNFRPATAGEPLRPSPDGRAEATGAPGAGLSTGLERTNPKLRSNAPAGISVAPLAPVPDARSCAPNKAADPDVRAKFMAAMHPPTMSIPARQPVARESAGPRT